MDYFVYILICQGNKLYTGITTDVKKRVREHCFGLSAGAKFTKSHKPEQIVALWKVEGRSVASKLEYKIKAMSKEQKRALIENPQNVTDIGEEFANTVCEEIPDIKNLLN